MTFLSRFRSNVHGDRQQPAQPPPPSAAARQVTTSTTTSSGNNSSSSLPPPPRASTLAPPPRGGSSRSTTPRPNGSRSASSTRNTTGQWNDTPGAPLRRPQLWRSNSQTWTRSKLSKERAAFWDTRVQGRAEAWAALRVAVEMSQAEDDVGAAAILEAAGLSCTTGRLNEGVWDEMGQLYKLPRWVVSDPTNVEEEDDDAVEKVEEKDVKKQEDAASPDEPRQRVPLRARLSDKGGDLLLKIEPGETARSIAARIVEGGKVADGARVRLAFMGKILKEGESLADQGWSEGLVVNALVFPPETR